MPKYQKKVETDVGTQYEYTDKQVEHRNREKAKRVQVLDAQLPKLRSKLRKDLALKDDKTRLTALAVSLIDVTYERVGNFDSAEAGHFGVTTWKKEHLTFSGNKVTIRYTGKSGVKQEKEVTNAPLVAELKKAVKGKKGDDYVFDCKGTCVRASDVNAYLKEFDVTAKDLRGLHANKLMKTYLKGIRKEGGALPKSRKERDDVLKKEFMKALKIVAKEVGHTQAILRSSYLVPAMEVNYMRDGTVIDKLDKKKTASRVALRYISRSTL